MYTGGKPRRSAVQRIGKRILAVAALPEERRRPSPWMISRVTSTSVLALVSNVPPVASMSSHGESGIVAAGSGRPCSRAPQDRRHRQAAARRIADQRDMIWL